MRLRALAPLLVASLLGSLGCDETKPADAGKPADAKAADVKAGDAEAADAKAADAKAPDAEASDAEAPDAEAPMGDGEADLKITGAITKTLTGKIVTCGTTRMDGRVQGGSWRIDDATIDVAIVALTDEELDDPKLVVNAKAPERKSYVPVPGGKITTAKDRTVAEIDMDLRNLVAKDDRIHVTGTMTCPPK